MPLDDCGNEHNKCAGWSADLKTATTQRRDDEATDDSRVKTLLRRQTRTNRNGHRKWQSDDGDGQSGNRIRSELRPPIPIAQHRHELGRK